MSQAFLDTRTLIQQYQEGYDVIHRKFLTIHKEDLHVKPDDEIWSIHDIFVHIVDADINSWQRFRKTIAEDNPFLSGYDQNRWCTELAYRDADLNDLFQLGALVRKIMIQLLEHLPESAWNRTARHEERGSIILKDLLHVYTRHIDAHLKQIDRILEKIHG